MQNIEIQKERIYIVILILVHLTKQNTSSFNQLIEFYYLDYRCKV